MHLAPETKAAGGAGTAAAAAPAAPPVVSEEQEEPPVPVTAHYPEPEESAEVRRGEERIESPIAHLVVLGESSSSLLRNVGVVDCPLPIAH